jgi:hypothetical protein
MIDAAQLMRMASSSADEDGCLAEYENSLRAGVLRQLGPPGKMTASETYIVFSIRAKHAQVAGVSSASKMFYIS